MQKLKKYFLLIWFTLTITVYSSVLVSPLSFEYGSLLSLAIPILIILNLIGLFSCLLFNMKKWWVYLILLIFAWPFFNVLVQFNSHDSIEEDDLKVLSYNVKWFIDARENNYQGVIDWLLEQEPDVLCLQEFYPRRNISARIIKDGGYENATIDSRSNVALYSKYPIINKGLLFPESELNNVLYADLQKDDQFIRVYSVHLQSMGINPEKIQDREGIQTEYEDVKLKLLKGGKERAAQVKVLLEHTQNSPHPVIIAGDFNDTPFSHNYFKLKRLYNNAHEHKGQWLGVTYNGKIPFLRIDHHFYDQKGLDLISFSAFDNIYYSDHFPLIGYYRIKP